jgi:polysaccharide export outer membrane protein
MERFKLKNKKHVRYSSCCIIAMILSMGILCSCANLKENEEILFQPTTFSFDQGTYPSQSGLFEDYRIATGDVLDVLFQFQTWLQKDTFPMQIGYTVSIKFEHAPELNETQVIQPDGMIVLPYIGEFYVANKTISELTAELKDKYRKILRDPYLYITVEDFQDRVKELKKDLHTAPRGLSRLVTVRPDGYATFPLLGDVFVAKRTFPRVSEILNEKYSNFLPGMHCDLFLERHEGSVIYVLGQVKKSGSYTINKPTNILQAAAMAGGFLAGSNKTNIMVFRKHERKLFATKVNLKNILSRKADREYFYLKPDDVVYVTKRKLTKSAEIMTEIGNLIMFRGWSLSGPLFEDALIGPNDDDDN